MKPAGGLIFYNFLCYQISLIAASFLPIPKYSIRNSGSPNTKDHRIYFMKGRDLISPLHDVTLFEDKKEKIFNMIVEIPRWTNAKMEMNMVETMNPIRQDLKDGQLRYVANVFPYHGYIWNYGALPQTWERPVIDSRTGKIGDNDPLDVIEIGEEVHIREIGEMGSVIQVKVLGSIALIDGGETDWKIIAINIKDPKAKLVNDISSLIIHFPHILRETFRWFSVYKIPSGGERNTFAFKAQPVSKEETLRIIDEMHENWLKMINQEVDINDRNCKHLIHDNIKIKYKSNCTMEQEEARAILKKAYPDAVDTPIFMEVDKMFYVKDKEAD